MQSAVQNMVRYARGQAEGLRIGELSRVKIAIKANREDCPIKEIIQYPRLPTIKAGQCITTFVKLAVPALAPREKRDQDEGTEESPAELFERLYEMLGETQIQLFTLDVSYAHSFFPKPIRLVMSTAVFIRRSDRLSTWTRRPAVDRENEYAVEYAKALFVARNWQPEAALKRLRRKFRAGWLEEGHASGLWQIREELEFQMQAEKEMQIRMITEEHGTEGDGPTQESGIEAPHQTFTGTVRGPMSGSEDGGTRVDDEVTRQSSGTLESAKVTKGLTISRRPSPTSGDANTFTNATVTSAKDHPIGQSHEHGQDQDQESGRGQEQDKARQIWRHMRRTSRSNSTSLLLDMRGRAATAVTASSESLDRLEMADEGLRELRREALRNKRSVGADTLREFRWEEGAQGGGSGVLSGFRNHHCGGI